MCLYYVYLCADVALTWEQYTAQEAGVQVGPGEQATLSYTFRLDPLIETRQFGLLGSILYSDNVPPPSLPGRVCTYAVVWLYLCLFLSFSLSFSLYVDFASGAEQLQQHFPQYHFRGGRARILSRRPDVPLLSLSSSFDVVWRPLTVCSLFTYTLFGTVLALLGYIAYNSLLKGKKGKKVAMSVHLCLFLCGSIPVSLSRSLAPPRALRLVPNRRRRLRMSGW
jgi:hypothetical protein